MAINEDYVKYREYEASLSLKDAQDADKALMAMVNQLNYEKIVDTRDNRAYSFAEKPALFVSLIKGILDLMQRICMPTKVFISVNNAIGIVNTTLKKTNTPDASSVITIERQQWPWSCWPTDTCSAL